MTAFPIHVLISYLPAGRFVLGKTVPSARPRSCLRNAVIKSAYVPSTS